MLNQQPTPSDFNARLDACARDIDALLTRLLGEQPESDEIARPKRLIEAMRYAALAGGKKLRPFLMIEAARLFDVPPARALMAGAALECVHCYSLAHDDLPAMDDDDLRRGRPSLHRAFDEATAILAGDALLTFAFDLLARDETHPDPAIRIALVAQLARASGLGGMAGGQMLDLAAEGRFAGEAAAESETEILALQAMKTGALLRFAPLAGAILGGASPEQRAALSRYGTALGAAFQIADDLLDVEGDAATMGKAARKDAASGKATLIGILGVTAARARLAALVEKAAHALEPFGARAGTLRQAAHFAAARPK